MAPTLHGIDVLVSYGVRQGDRYHGETSPLVSIPHVR